MVPAGTSASAILALVDGNSFYASCERLFRPDLAGRPVIVLSNNDGCVVARSLEAKALGIRMGQPMHEIRALCRRERVAVFSSNYTLYGDISARMNAVYRSFTPVVEVYSIDESFLDLSGHPAAGEDLAEFGQEIRSRVRRWTGIPTCVGLGPTKTLAKVANWHAKQYQGLAGVCDMMDPAAREPLLRAMAIEEIWGIGPAYAARLARLGIGTAAALRDADLRLVRQELGVVGARIAAELRGISCLPLELAPPAPKSCAVTRSFGRPVEKEDEARAAVIAFASRAGEKLRQTRMAAGSLSVFIHTSPFRPGPGRSDSASAALPEATADTRDLVETAVRLFACIWRPGFAYSGAGVILSDLEPADRVQRTLLPGRDRDRSAALMSAIDSINRRHGRDTISLFGAAVGRRDWQTQFRQRSPRYTTRIDELPRVRA